jgi:hypothetical protein
MEVCLEFCCYKKEKKKRKENRIEVEWEILKTV